MLTFWEYINHNCFNETINLRKSEVDIDCDNDLQNLIMWHADNLDKSDEFLQKMDKILRKCYVFHLNKRQNKIIFDNIVDKEDLINRTLNRIHNTIRKKIENNTLDYSTVIGLIKKMIKSSFVDIVRSMNRVRRIKMLQHNVIGTDVEPRSLKDDPSFENIGIEDILKVPNLTNKEKFVLKSRADGKQNKDIAAELGVVNSYPIEIYNDAKRKIKEYYGFN